MAEFSRLPHRMPAPPADSDVAGLACRIEGEAAPYLAVELNPGQELAFDPQCLLWREPSVAVHRGAAAGVMLARGPGRAGFARGLGGMIFPIPLAAGAAVQIAQGQALVAYGAGQTHEHTKGLGDRLTGGAGKPVDRFIGLAGGGVVWVQARGDVFERGLNAGEMFDLQPDAFLCKDVTVTLETLYPIEQEGTGFDFACLRLTGPGRVAFQSAPAATWLAAAATGTDLPRTGGLRGVAGSLLGRRQG